MKGFQIIIGIFLYQIFLVPVHEFGLRFSLNYLSIIIYLVESLLWFLSFIFILRFFKNNSVNDIITMIGKYTLLGYMAQMVLVRLGYFILGGSRIAGPGSYFINLTLGGICLYIFVLVTDHFRNRTNLVRQSYRLIFQ